MIDLSPLDPFCYPDPPSVPGLTAPVARAGRRGPVGFVYTLSHDGQVELSLARLGSRHKQTDAMVEAFFRFLGVVPFREESREGAMVRHFVVVRGRMQ